MPRTYIFVFCIHRASSPHACVGVPLCALQPFFKAYVRCALLCPRGIEGEPSGGSIKQRHFFIGELFFLFLQAYGSQSASSGNTALHAPELLGNVFLLHVLASRLSFTQA